MWNCTSYVAECVDDALIEAIDSGIPFSWLPNMGYPAEIISSIWRM